MLPAASTARKTHFFFVLLLQIMKFFAEFFTIGASTQHTRVCGNFSGNCELLPCFIDFFNSSKVYIYYTHRYKSVVFIAVKGNAHWIVHVYIGAKWFGPRRWHFPLSTNFPVDLVAEISSHLFKYNISYIFSRQNALAFHLFLYIYSYIVTQLYIIHVIISLHLKHKKKKTRGV